jgi:hypothetical protein
VAGHVAPPELDAAGVEQLFGESAVLLVGDVVRLRRVEDSLGGPTLEELIENRQGHRPLGPVREDQVCRLDLRAVSERERVRGPSREVCLDPGDG